jgi:hypothetical protein
VLGSGCGVAGGNPVALFNGGIAPPGWPQGADGLLLPATEPTVWYQGSVVEVAWAITANHGGGYSYRLCRCARRLCGALLCTGRSVTTSVSAPDVSLCNAEHCCADALCGDVCVFVCMREVRACCWEVRCVVRR